MLLVPSRTLPTTSSSPNCLLKALSACDHGISQTSGRSQGLGGPRKQGDHQCGVSLLEASLETSLFSFTSSSLWLFSLEQFSSYHRILRLEGPIQAI